MSAVRGLQNADEARATIERARLAQPGWAALSIADRRARLRRLPGWLAANADRAAAVIAEATGKTRFDALVTEILPSALAIDYCCRHAARFLAPERLRGGSLLAANKRSVLHREPWGVVGIIAPWNYPLSIPVFDITAALLAGNAVVFKTAPETLPVGKLADDLFSAAGLPAGVFNEIPLDGPVAGETFLADGGVDKLSFTGSVEVGKWLSRRAAERLVPLTLELGGNDAMIVCADANLERAANGAVWAGMQNAGQTCAAVERIYCERAVYDDFLARLKHKVEALRIGPDADHGVDIGAMCTPAQTRKVRVLVDEALAAGARVHAVAAAPESPAPDGREYLPAMVITHCNHSMRLVNEETFGPVVTVMPVDSLEQAIEYANDSIHGLTASVWTSHRRRGREAAARLEAGVVTVNDHLLSHGMMETPWGGIKQSGHGRAHGRFSFEAMTRTKCVIEERLPRLNRNAFWPPYDAALYRAMRGTMDFLYGSSLILRFKGLKGFLTVISRMLRR